ncbi:MAG: primosomal protein N' [Patescibacteria group bacterium]|nr:primosomal protein N' [Patescibacteria group bacterium]
MIAKIIPLTRLPRAFSFFDYTIPENLEKSLKTGQLVEIPFRSKSIFGIVYDIEKNDNEKLKELKSIVNEIAIFSKKQLEMYLLLSEIYLISPSVLLKMSLLPLQKRKLQKIALQTFTEKAKKENTQSYHFYNSKEEHKKIYKNIENNSLLIVPEVRQIEEIKKILPKKLQDKIVVWYSELSTKQKFENWLQIKNGEKTIIIGTRNALFLPFNNLDKIIIDFEHDENLKSWDSTPKFQTKDIVKFLQKLYSCDISFASFSPSFEKYYEINKGQIEYSQKLTKDKLLFKNTKSNLPTVINISNKNFSQNKSVFSLDLEERIRTATKDVFIYINRKGFATTTQCLNCGYIARDPQTNLPLIYDQSKNILYSPYSKFSQKFSPTCPECKSELIKNYGYGTELVEQEVKKIMNTESSHDIIKLDKDSNQLETTSNQARIIIGTNAAIKAINWEQTDLIIFLDIDRQLAIPEYLSQENIWHNIQEINYYRNEQSKFYIQTNNPEHTIFKSLGEKDRIYRTELNTRQKLGLFPYQYVVKYYCGTDSENKSKNLSEQTAKNVMTALTKLAKNATILGPYEMQPKYFRKQYWYGFALKIADKNSLSVIRQINQYIPGNFKIDPNPISLLSP